MSQKSQSPFSFFLILLLSTVSIQSSLVYAIRHKKEYYSASKVFSLPLHRRDSIIKPQHKDYAALTLSRIESDVARVKYINSKIGHAIFNSEHNIQPDDDLQIPITPISSGNEYAAHIRIGNPAKEFYLVADTGSHVNWIQCTPCVECYTQTHPIFDPSKSSTYRPLSCESKQCRALGKYANCSTGSNSPCTYDLVYGFGFSETEGELAEETLSFGSSASFENVTIGCGHDNWGFNDFEGILGLGWNKLALPAQIKAKSFSYCLPSANSTSSSTLEFNSAMPADAIVTRLIKNPKTSLHYYVELTGITIGKHKISVPKSVYKIRGKGTGGIIIDSGTTATFLDEKICGPVRETFRNHSQNVPRANGSYLPFDTCYNVSSGNLSSVDFPEMSFQFSGGRTLPLSPEHYLYAAKTDDHDQSKVFCLAILSGEVGDVSIIGNVQLKGMRVTYDLSNKFIGFSPNQC